ncbi:MAG TPA: hypothetical protein VNM39_13860 [Verrucomicrobiae bacterium]|nr:hypothetical protein [Verrucomicrobiae bacterium]
MARSPRRYHRHAWVLFAAAIVLGTQPRRVHATVFEARISSSKDDAEEFADGTMYLGSSDLELVMDSNLQTVGVRWPSLAIPHNATITSAWIQWTAKSSQAGPTNLDIAAEDTADAAPFTSTAFNITSRARTSVVVNWDPGPWRTSEAGANERTPDLSSVVQVVVSRIDWAAGNAMAILVRGTGVRTAWSWDGDPAAAALLHVEFSGGDEPPPPSTWPVALYVGYFDTHHPGLPQPKPDPWRGSPGVVFAGTPDPDGGWDTSCLRLDNLSWHEITDVVASVDMGPEHFALWGAQTIPPHGTLIFAQTAFENFDGSDSNEAGCPTCDPSWCMTKVNSTIPVITIRVGSNTTRYYDRDQVINTRGVDAAGCPYTGGRNDESHPWVQLSPDAMTLGAPDSLSLPGPTAVALAAPVPNPARGSVVLRFRMPSPGRVQLGVYDLAGRLVRMCVDAELEAGEYLRGLDLAGVEPGIYFGILRAPRGVARRALVVTR